MKWDIDGKLPTTNKEKEVIVGLEGMGLASRAEEIEAATRAAGERAKVPEEKGRANDQAIEALESAGKFLMHKHGHNTPLMHWCYDAAYVRRLAREHGLPKGRMDPEIGADVIGEDSGRGPIYVAVGNSNGKAVHEATGARVYAELTTHPIGLEVLAKRLALKAGKRPLVLCAAGTGEGERAAREVAATLGAAAVVARLAGDHEGARTSFARLLKAEGPTAVSRQVREGACKAVELGRQRAREAEGPARDVEHSPSMSR